MTFPRPHETPAPAVAEEEKTYKVTMHLTNGDVFEVHDPVPASDLLRAYECLGAKESRIKFPTAPDTMHFLPAKSILRIEAVGEFE